MSAPSSSPAGSQRRVLRRLFLLLILRTRRRGRVAVPRPPYATLTWALLLYTLLGCISLSLQELPLLMFAAYLQSFSFLLTGLQLASSGGQVLFSPQEADILLHRPVEPRALLAAKVESLILLNLAMAGALNLVPMVAGAQSSGTWWFAAAHFAAVALNVVFTAGLVTLAYNLCLHWFGRERLESFLTTVQVMVAMGIILGGQILPRALRHLPHTAFDHPPLWLTVLPPFWFAALETLLVRGGRELLPFAALGLGLTFLVVWLGLRRLAGSYVRGLVALQEVSEAGASGRRARGRLVSFALRLPLFSWWLRDPVERASFRLTLTMLGRARGVKLRIFPQAAQFLVYPLIFIVGGRGAVPIDTFGLAFAGAFVAMLPATMIDQLRLSEDFLAAELFLFAPIRRGAALFQGARKAIIAALVTPGLLTIMLLACFFVRDRRVLLVLLPGLLALPLCTQLAGLGDLFIPFSRPPEQARLSTRGCLLTGMSLLVAGLIAGLAGFAWHIGRLPLLLAIEAPLVWGLTWALRRSMDRRLLTLED